MLVGLGEVFNEYACTSSGSTAASQQLVDGVAGLLTDDAVVAI